MSNLSVGRGVYFCTEDIIPPGENFLLTSDLFIRLFTAYEYLAKMKFVIQDLLGQSDSEFEQYLEDFVKGWRINDSFFQKINICGPEYDAMGYGHDEDEDDYGYAETERVPEDRLERIFKTIAILPSLREIAISPSYYSENDDALATSRLCWLLSKDSKVETLGIRGLEVHDQADVEKLALAFSTATSIKSLCIDKMYIGYRDVKTLVPLMEALAQLPMTKIRLVLDSYGKDEATKRYAQESLAVFKQAYPHEMKDAAFFLELALWKSKIDMKYHDAEGGDQLRDDTATDMRGKCRINCGSEIIIPNVLPFLTGLHGVELKTNPRSAFWHSYPELRNCIGLDAGI